MDYRCYCCGGELGETFALVSYDRGVDRVFLMRPEHAEQTDAMVITLVHVAAPPPSAEMREPGR